MANSKLIKHAGEMNRRKMAEAKSDGKNGARIAKTWKSKNVVNIGRKKTATG
ncbi:MAG: hypothetical protein IOC85_16430 [Rhodobacter sp.]|nr:hypothetical protein [Rhodobacter sp.]MCA3495061.1 hypothetical protein [Rhodobacter sp.]